MDEIESTRQSRLSRRQLQCLELVAQGYTSKQIGRTLSLSPSTVDNHIRGALERLNFSDRATAARALRAEALGGDRVYKPPSPHPAMLKLPPLGGTINTLSARHRVWHIVQIALLGIMGMAAAVITIAGLVNLFSR